MKKILTVLLCLSLLCVPVKAAEDEKLVALTFDDGPSGRFTRALLEGLAERNVKATFLLCGYRMEQYPALTEQIFQEGHEIGIHGYSHQSLAKSCKAEADREIRKAMALIPDGCRVSFFRAPGGTCSQGAREAAQDWDLAVLNWSVDPRDWATRDAAAVEKTVIDQVRDGDVILLHDMSDSSVEAALVIVDQLQSQGFRFVTVSELARARGIVPEPGKVYFRFAGN